MYSNTENMSYKQLCEKVLALEDAITRMRRDNEDSLYNIDADNLSSSVRSDLTFAKTFAQKDSDGNISLRADTLNLKNFAVSGNNGAIKLTVNDGTPYIEFYNANGAQIGTIYPSASGHTVTLDAALPSGRGTWSFTGNVTGAA